MWETREEFLGDLKLRLDGYQANFKKLNAGWFLFTHYIPQCHSTFSLSVGLFSDLSQGERYALV